MKFTRLLFVPLITASALAGCRKTPDTAGVLYSELKSVNKIVLARMSVSKMATIEDLDFKDADGLKQTGVALLDAIKIGERKAAYSYDTYIRAYVDMSDFSPEDVSVDDVVGSIVIKLPEIRTEFAGRDAAIREEHYRVTGLRSAIDPKERADMKEKMNTVLKAEVEANPVFRRKIIDVAKSKGDSFFRALAAKDGYTVTISFENGEGGVL